MLEKSSSSTPDPDSLRSLREQLDQAHDRLLSANEQIESFKKSTSWRITAPLRTVKDFFKKIGLLQTNDSIPQAFSSPESSADSCELLPNTPLADPIVSIAPIDRKELILRYVNKDQLGIEVSPWHAPIAPKKLGYNIKTLDIFDIKTLVEICKKDPNTHHLWNEIENVDIVSSATDIGDVIVKNGQSHSFDYILSSHNFEHLPDPIRFLQGCGQALKNGGILSMAIPDKRYTFDYFRPNSTTGHFLEAYIEKRTQPSKYQIFEFGSTFANHISPDPRFPTSNPSFNNDIRVAFASLNNYKDGQEAYSDAHVHVFTSTSFELIILELIYLNLIPFKLLEITNNGFEFVAHLENVGLTSNLSKEAFEAKRIELSKRILLD